MLQDLEKNLPNKYSQIDLKEVSSSNLFVSHYSAIFFDKGNYTVNLFIDEI